MIHHSEEMPVSKSSEPFAFENWCRRELSRLLKFPVGDDLVSYLLSMQSAKDVDEYLMELLGEDTLVSREFRRDFTLHWHPPERTPSAPSAEEGQLMEALVRPQQEEMVLFADRKEGGGKGAEVKGRGKQQKGKEKKEGSGLRAPPGFSAIHATTFDGPSKTRSGDMVNEQPSARTSVSRDAISFQSSAGGGRGTAGGGRHKQKFVPLMSAEGQSRATPQLPGRYPCQCLAQRHALVNNCVECGRIVCAQEGSGSCLFCGTLVCTPEEEEVLARDSKKGHKMRDKLLKQFDMKDGGRTIDHIRKVEASGGLSKAVQHKDKLLEFDQTSVRRTKVLDDELDYFSVDSNHWLTEGQRGALQKREEELRDIKYGSRRNKAVTLDFAGRRIVEEASKMEIYDEQHIQDLVGSEGNVGLHGTEGHTGALYNPAIPIDPPKYQETQPHKKLKPWVSTHKDCEDQEERHSILRVQDRALQEMKDEGKCLSMQQPWASLLVAGIKRFEGRTWYTTHRGRLWIAATIQKPDTEEIRQSEEFYRRLYGEKELGFPADYPVSCLLGCVDVVDCLSQEEYQEQFPKGESESPYVFIVKNPQQLTVKFPVKGNHKIWKLPQDVHTAAKRGSKPSRA